MPFTYNPAQQYAGSHPDMGRLLLSRCSVWLSLKMECIFPRGDRGLGLSRLEGRRLEDEGGEASILALASSASGLLVRDSACRSWLDRPCISAFSLACTSRLISALRSQSG